MIRQDEPTIAIAQAIEDNLVAYATFFGTTPNAELRDEPDYLSVITPIPTLPFTGILRPYPQQTVLAETVSRTMTYFGQKHARPSWIFNPRHSGTELPKYLAQFHLQQSANIAGMAAPLHSFQMPSPRLDISSVTDEAVLAMWVNVYAVSNGAPQWIEDELVKLFTQTGYGDNTPLQLYLVWQSERPVATAAAFSAAGVVGLYEVATLPDIRRQGVASLLTQQILTPYNQGDNKLATLLASSMAESLYKRLGFTEYCRLAIYN